MEKIIIDTDIGIDDAFAIILAAMSPKLEIKGITTVEGNCSIENVINNTFKVLDMCGRNDIPVYRGKETSLVLPNIDATDVHGENGMGGVIFEPIPRQIEAEDAIDYLIRMVKESPKEITIVAIGPLTNIASAILKDPDFATNVKQVIVMGGSITKGNVTPYAEFNFYKDPDAAEVVLKKIPEKLVIIGLDVTTKIPLSAKYETMLKQMKQPMANFLYDITRVGAKYDRQQLGMDGYILNDPLTIAYLLDPSIITLIDCELAIETRGEKQGAIQIQESKKEGRIKYAIQVDTNKFFSVLFTTIFPNNLKEINRVLDK